ncbi:hypothetical protein BV20DRAFT_1054726 [Pilatotrama ljubarskyi]|nr:hypothetical protein BV20DRAFT_1054726 [Pilatotrama ljubarskyi]
MSSASTTPSFLWGLGVLELPVALRSRVAFTASGLSAVYYYYLHSHLQEHTCTVEMDRCPAEVLDLIFAKACSDDGSTGRSLALVSKRIRDLSSRHALQSVALYGSHQISAFATLLEGRTDEDRRVRHLYLTDRRKVSTEHAPAEDKETCMARRLSDQFHADGPSTKYPAEPILRVLRIVAPHLRMLAFLLFGNFNENPLTMPFPALEELTIHTWFWWTGPSRTPTLPSLCRLHIILDNLLPRTAVQTITSLAPHLTHLRLSCLSASPRACSFLLPGLKRMVTELEGAEASDSTQPCLPSSVQRVIVQMSQARRSDKLQARTSHSQQLSPACTLTNRIVVVRPQPRAIGNFEDDFDDYARAQADFHSCVRASWQSRIFGEEGLWKVDPSDIVGMHGVDAELLTE